MQFPDKSNTPATPPPKKEVKPLVSGVVQVKRPATRRFLDYLFAESPKKLGAKVGRDVIVPRIKAGFEEAANAFLSGMLWGDSANRPASMVVKQAMMRGSGINYAGISNGTSPQALALQASQQRSTGNYKDLVCPSQDRAEILLAGMYELLNQYRVVTVGDLYEMASITPDISDNAYGWTTLDGARISKVRDGYLLELPHPTLI